MGPLREQQAVLIRAKLLKPLVRLLVHPDLLPSNSNYNITTLDAAAAAYFLGLEFKTFASFPLAIKFRARARAAKPQEPRRKMCH